MNSGKLSVLKANLHFIVKTLTATRLHYVIFQTLQDPINVQHVQLAKTKADQTDTDRCNTLIQ